MVTVRAGRTGRPSNQRRPDHCWAAGTGSTAISSILGAASEASTECPAGRPTPWARTGGWDSTRARGGAEPSSLTTIAEAAVANVAMVHASAVSVGLVRARRPRGEFAFAYLTSRVSRSSRHPHTPRRADPTLHTVAPGLVPKPGPNEIGNGGDCSPDSGRAHQGGSSGRRGLRPVTPGWGGYPIRTRISDPAQRGG